MRVKYDIENNSGRAYDENGLCVADYDFTTDVLEVYDDLDGVSEEDIVEAMLEERKEIESLGDWSDENDQKY